MNNEKRVLLSAWLDTTKTSPQQFNELLSLNTSCFHFAQNIPLDELPPLDLIDFTNTDAILLLSVLPKNGLYSIRDEDLTSLVYLCSDLNKNGRRILLRFGPDMNAPWNIWGQKPHLYIMMWRKLQTLLSSVTNQTLMIWSPFEGSGYPFPNEKYSPTVNTRDYASLDTNRDGVLDAKDDPYSPYYPGDDYVDWVGLDIYYRGEAYPWVDNALPKPLLFYNLLHGIPNKPDFYQLYSVARKKPMAIPETGAVYHLDLDLSDTPGPSSASIKSTWWRQFMTNSTFLDLHPNIRLISLNEYIQPGTGPEDGLLLDYSISSSSNVSSLFAQDLKTVESKYEYAKLWDYRTTFTRNPYRSNPSFAFPPWAIALMFLIPIFILVIWVVSAYCRKKPVVLEPAFSDTSSTRGKIDIGDVDDSATIINEPGTIIEISSSSTSLPHPHTSEMESLTVPLDRTPTL